MYDKPTSKNSHFPWAIIVIVAFLPIAFLIGMGLGYVAWGKDAAQLDEAQATISTMERELTQAQTVAASARSTQQAEVDQAQQVELPEEQEVVRYDISVDDDPSIGPEDAPITIIEFSDYQCPFCQRWHVESFDKILEEYPDQVRIVYRDFPLTSIHPEAVPAAQAANCAYEQDAFWEFHGQLFSGENQLSSDTYSQIAKDIGLDMNKFEQCVSSEKYADEVQSDLSYAINLGVKSTPTFFLNGIPLVGAQPYEVFKEIIDLELAGEIP